jgi:pimeloyl-ACP methyl ester carboxylesterase
MKRPTILNTLLEPVRAGGEFATTTVLIPLMPMLPHGDGHPVLVIPGFMGGDGSTGRARSFLSRLDYPALKWGLGRNIGPTPEVMEGLPRLLESTAEQYGQPVSIVGWSLGGVYARWLGARYAEMIRVIVTLGSPVHPEIQTASNLTPIYNSLRQFHVDDTKLFVGGEPLPVPVTAIYTISDAIVHWETCIIDDGPISENLRVAGSHLGLAFNPAVLHIVADRLAQPEGEWQPFEIPRVYSGVIKHHEPEGVA